MEEIFNNVNLTLNEKVEQASLIAMSRVNAVIKQNIDNYHYWQNRSKIISVKYEDSDLYRLEQKAKAKRECKCQCQ